MTVFLAIRSKFDGSHMFLSDCLLTSDGEQKLDIELPFQKVLSGASFTTYHLGRKAFFPHPRIMLLWAGSQLVAKILARHLAANVDQFLVDSDDASFKWLIAERLTFEQAKLCSFMLVRIFPLARGGMRIRRNCFDCRKNEDEKFEYFGAGSGFEIASKNMWLGSGDMIEDPAAEINNVHQKAIGVLSNLIGNDAFTDSYSSFRVGGWYEIISATVDGFVSEPYSISTFKSHEGGWDFIGRFSSFYENGRLMVIRTSYDFLAELEANPSYRFTGKEFAAFPATELYIEPPITRKVNLTLHDIFGRSSKFALNIFLNSQDNESTIAYSPGHDALSFGPLGNEIRFNMEALSEIVKGLPNGGRLL